MYKYLVFLFLFACGQKDTEHEYFFIPHCLNCGIKYSENPDVYLVKEDSVFVIPKELTFYYQDINLHQENINVVNNTNDDVIISDISINSVDNVAGDGTGKCFSINNFMPINLKPSQSIQVIIIFCNSTIESEGLLKINTTSIDYSVLEANLMGKIFAQF